MLNIFSLSVLSFLLTLSTSSIIQSASNKYSSLASTVHNLLSFPQSGNYRTDILEASSLVSNLPINNYAIYIDSSNNQTNPNGTVSNPFPTLDQAFQEIESNSDQYLKDSNITLYIQPALSPYILINSYNFSSNTTSLTLMGWPQSHWEGSIEICSQLPLIMGNASLTLSRFIGVQIVSLAIQPLSFNLEKVQNVSFLDFCLEEGDTKSEDQILIDGAEFIQITNIYTNLNSNKPRFYVSNIQVQIGIVNMTVGTDLTFASTGNQTASFMIFGGMKNTTFSLDSFNFDSGESPILVSNIIYLQDINNLSLSNIELIDLDLQPKSMNLGIINAFNPQNINFENLIVFNTKVEGDPLSTFFMFVSRLEIFLTINLNNLNFSNSKISGEGAFDLVHVYMGNSFNLNNHTIYNNTFTNGSVINLQNNATTTISLQIDGVLIQNNSNKDNQTFSYLSAYDVMMESLSASNIMHMNNKLVGRIIAISSVVSYVPGSTKPPKYFSIENLYIVNNTAQDTSIFFFEVMNSNSNQFPDYYPMIEPFLLKFNNVQIIDNNFSKGSSQLWLYQVGLFHGIGAWMYINNSNVTGNSFSDYGVFLLEQQLASVFFTHSSVNHNHFKRSLLIHTNYADVSVSGGDSEKNGTMIAPYRYSFVTFSNFSANQLYKNALFNLKNAFTIIYSNSFVDFEFELAQLLNGGQYLPPPLTTLDPYYSRSLEYENITLSFDPELYALFNYSYVLVSQKNESIIFFYLVFQNGFKHLKSDVNVIVFNQYNFPQSIIMIYNNSFTEVSFYSPLVNLFVADTINYFAFDSNNMSYFEGPGYLVFMPEMGNKQLIDLNNNSIQNVSGPGILSADGSSISGLTLSNNTVFNTSFWITGVDISVITNAGNITIAGNEFTNISLLASMDSLFTQYSLISIKIQMSAHDCAVNITNNIFSDLMADLDQILIKDAFQNSLFYLFVANSSLIISNATMIGVDMLSSGNLMYIGATKISITDSVISEVISQSQTGMIYLLSEDMTINNNTLSRLVSAGGGSIYLASTVTRSVLKSISLKMNNNSFFNCTGTLGTILYAQVPNLTISLINNNFSTSSEVPLLSLAGPESICWNCLLLYNQIFLISNSETQLISVEEMSSGSLFINSTLVKTHIIPEQRHSNVRLYSKLTFISAKSSPFLYITVTNLSFEGLGDLPVSCELISADSIIFDLFNSRFDSLILPETGFINLYTLKTEPGAVTLYLSNVTISNVLSSAMGEILTGVISVTNNQTLQDNPLNMIDKDQEQTTYINIMIEDCHFKDLVYTSALAFQRNFIYSTTIKNSSFVNCQNMYGGAIFDLAQSMNKSYMGIFNSKFTGNSARLGGAILLGNTTAEFKNNTFSNNSAEFAGGAVYTSGQANYLNLAKDNFFKDNHAKYGDDLSSIPFRFNIEFTNAEELGIVVTSNPNGPILLSNVSSFSFPDLNIVMYLVDLYERNSSDFSANPFYIFNFINMTTASAFNCSHQSCFIEGLNAIISGNAGSTIQVTVDYISEIELPQFQFSVILRECLVGEYNNSYTKTCDPCLQGTFSLSTNQTCQDCPGMAFCAGGSSICPMPGYWAPLGGTYMYNCPTPDLCLGGCPSQCAEGYTGPLCEACDIENGYLGTGFMVCGECANTKYSLIITSVIVFGYFLYSVVCVYTMFQGNEVFIQQPDGVHAHIEIEKAYYVRLLITYTQIISLIFNLNFNFQEYLTVISQIGNPSNMIVYGLQCTLSAMNFDSQQYIYYATIITVLSPIAQFIGIGLIVLIAKLIIKTKKALRFWYLSGIYIIMMMQPGIINHLASMLSCDTLYPGSPQYMVYNPTWECYTEEYNFYLYLVIIPGLVVFGLLIPIVIGYRLLNNKTKLDDEHMVTSMGTFYNDMKRKYYYWGLYLMILKIIISFLGPLMNADLKTKVLTILIFLWIYYSAVSHYRPYRFKQFNLVERNTFLVFLISVIMAYYYLDNPYTVPRILAIVIMIILNAAVMLFIIFKLLKIFFLRSLYFVENKLGRRKRKLTERSLYNKKSSLLYEKDLQNTDSFLEEESPTRINRTSSFDDLQAGNSFYITPQTVIVETFE